MSRVLSRGAAVLAVSFMFAACGDDTTTGQDSGIPDFSMNVSPPDFSVPPDMLALGTAQLVLADVEGTFYNPAAPGGIPFTHLMVANQSFPHLPSNPQYVDPNFSGAAGMVHGCSANRYDLAAGPFPSPDENVGLVTYTGYETGIVAVTATGTPATPISEAIACQFGGATMPAYGCAFATLGDGGTSTLDGQSPNSVAFPPLGLPAGIPACPAGTTAHQIGATAFLCEQHPFKTDGTTAITESIEGGSSYGAQPNKKVPSTNGLPNGVHIVTVNGAAPANPFDPFGGLVLDGSTDLTIVWSCDGSATPGGGCPTGAAGITDLLGLLAVASTNSRDQFAFTSSFGSAQCAEQLGATGATVVLKKEAQQKLLMGQTAGSVLIAIVRLKANASSTNGHFVFFTAGQGNFGLLTHP